MEVFKMLPEGTLAQVVNDNLIITPTPFDKHQDILVKIVSRIYLHVEKNDLGKVRCSPYDVYLDEFNAFQPDIVFIANENAYKIEANGLHGAPDLVIEILSPSNEKYDKKYKKNIYERYGVKEYWIIDPATKEVLLYKLINGNFVEENKINGVIKSVLLDITIKF